MRSTRYRGLTLVEVVVSSAVLLLMLSLLAGVVDQTASYSHYDLASSDARSAARVAILLMTRELADAGSDATGEYMTTHPRATGGSGSTISFSRRLSITGQASDWSAPITYRLDPDPGETPGNGLDDDGDGLVDEGQLVRQETGPDVVLARNVMALAFTRPAGGDALSISFTVARPVRVGGESDVVSHTVSTSVKIRNQP